MGYSPRRICGIDDGAVEYTDGTFVWHEGLAHYILEHSVRLPNKLVRHARERPDTLESREVTPASLIAVLVLASTSIVFGLQQASLV